MYLEIIGQLSYRFSMLFMNNILAHQIGQAMNGVAAASDVAFSSYVYGRFEKDQYKK